MAGELLLEGLIKLRGKIRGDLATMGEVCRFVGAEKEDIEPVARELEARGLITCSPKMGPIAVVSLPEAGAVDVALGRAKPIAHGG
jgi:hypothetical protein